MSAPAVALAAQSIVGGVGHASASVLAQQLLDAIGPELGTPDPQVYAQNPQLKLPQP